LQAGIERLHGYARAAGRDPSAIGIETWLPLETVPEDDRVSRVQNWCDLGATHLTIDTMGLGLRAPDEHLEQLRQMKELLGL
jgi:hypothetical protein